VVAYCALETLVAGTIGRQPEHVCPELCSRVILDARRGILRSMNWHQGVNMLIVIYTCTIQTPGSLCKRIGCYKFQCASVSGASNGPISTAIDTRLLGHRNKILTR
jgi:hypothetical protein